MTALVEGNQASVSRETADALASFAQLVRKWSPRINLISKADLDDVEDRHIADSLQLFFAAPDSARLWVDLGSGGGFPAIPLAILAREKRADLRFILVESDQRKAAFLRTAARELGLDITVEAVRIEELEPCCADVVSARALAPLPRLLAYAHRHLAPDGIALLPKGRNATAEIEEARGDWRFDLDQSVSITSPEARILIVSRLTPCQT